MAWVCEWVWFTWCCPVWVCRRGPASGWRPTVSPCLCTLRSPPRRPRPRTPPGPTRAWGTRPRARTGPLCRRGSSPHTARSICTRPAPRETHGAAWHAGARGRVSGWRGCWQALLLDIRGAWRAGFLEFQSPTYLACTRHIICVSWCTLGENNSRQQTLAWQGPLWSLPQLSNGVIVVWGHLPFCNHLHSRNNLHQPPRIRSDLVPELLDLLAW